MISTQDLLHICVRQVFRQRRRNFGVALAIALGTAGLIAILTLGDEVKRNVNHDLDLLGGATIIRLSFTSSQDPTLPPQTFLPESIKRLREQPGIESVSASTEKINYVPLFWRMKQLAIPVLGVDEQFMRVSGLVPVEGRFLEAADIDTQARVCVIGEELAQTLFEDESPVGQYIPLQADVYRVVGVVGGLQIGDRKKAAMLPLSTISNRSRGDMRADRLIIRCVSLEAVTEVAAAIPAILSGTYDPQYLKLEVGWQQLERVTTIIWWVQLFVAISITATLVLGGFGILNGMLSAVAARTREIGLKKAMGAEEGDIKLQFLAESVVLSVGAALIGIILGLGAVMLGAYFMHTSPSLLLFLGYAGMSLAFSAGMGVAAGYYPALRAAKMDAVMAIRYE